MRIPFGLVTTVLLVLAGHGAARSVENTTIPSPPSVRWTFW